GDVWQVKYRAAHAGPRELGCSPYFCSWLYDRQLNGAGALMDYCSYGAVLARCLLGMPSRVTGVAGRLSKEDTLVQDNAILIMTYPRAMAVAEGSWSQVGHYDAYVPRIYGSRGVLVVSPRKGRTLVMATDKDAEGVQVPVPLVVPEVQNASNH